MSEIINQDFTETMLVGTGTSVVTQPSAAYGGVLKTSFKAYRLKVKVGD